jgi:hypothetical protein
MSNSDLDTVCMDSVYSSFTSLREKLNSNDTSECNEQNNEEEKEKCFSQCNIDCFSCCFILCCLFH